MKLRVLLALAVLLVPTVWAATPPPARPWSPANSLAITAFAASADGSTFVTTHPATTSGQLPIGTPNTKDATIYDFARGPIFNLTCQNCAGRVSAAVSAAGDYVSLGSGAASGNVALLRRDGAGFVSVSGWPKTLAGTAHAIGVSAQAEVVAVLHGTGDATSLQVYSRDGSPRHAFPAGANPPFDAHQGRLNAVAVSGDGAWVAVGGAARQGNDTRGVVYIFNPGNSNPRGLVDLPSEVTSLTISHDGLFLAAGTANGVFANIVRVTEAGTLNRHIFPLTAPVNDIALSANAGTVAVAHGGGVSLFHRVMDGAQRFNVTRAWTANVSGATDVGISGDGRTLVAATTGGGLGFAAQSPAPLYTLQGSPTRAAIGADGLRVVFAGGTTVSAHTHQPGLAIERLDAQGNPLPAGSPPLSVRPGEPAVFRVAVTNNGTAPETVDLVLPQDANADIRVNRTSFELRPGDRGLATVTVTPGNLLPDTYSVVLRAVGATAGTRNLSLDYTVGAKSGVSLLYTGKTAFTVGRQQTVAIDFGVLNVGNDGGHFTLRTSQAPSRGGAWTVNLTPDAPTFVARQASSAGRLVVKVPTTTADGTTNDIRLVAVMGNATSLPIDLSFIVNPVVAGNLTADARGRLVTAGNAAWYNLTVKNTGTVPATFHLTWDPVERVPRAVAWNSEVTGLRSDGTLVLNPGESKAVQAKLFAPRDAPSGATGVLHLYLKETILGPKRNSSFTEWLNLSATVVPRDAVTAKVDGGGLVVPGPAGLLLAVAVVGAAYLARRRSA